MLPSVPLDVLNLVVGLLDLPSLLCLRILCRRLHVLLPKTVHTQYIQIPSKQIVLATGAKIRDYMIGKWMSNDMQIQILDHSAPVCKLSHKDGHVVIYPDMYIRSSNKSKMSIKAHRIPIENWVIPVRGEILFSTFIETVISETSWKVHWVYHQELHIHDYAYRYCEYNGLERVLMVMETMQKPGKTAQIRIWMILESKTHLIMESDESKHRYYPLPGHVFVRDVNLDLDCVFESKTQVCKYTTRYLSAQRAV